MKSLSLACFLVFLSLANVALAKDCLISGGHGIAAPISLGGAKSLLFKGFKPVIKFVAAPSGAAPAIKVTGASTSVFTDTHAHHFIVGSSKCKTAPVVSAPAPAPALAPVVVAAPPGKVSVAVVEVSVTLGGYTAETFGATEKTAFTAGIATAAKVLTSKVTITKVANALRRRNLLAGSITVDFEIEAASAAAADSAGALVKSVDLKATLTTAGLTKVESTAVVVKPAKTKFVDAPVVATPAPAPAVAAAVPVASSASRTSSFAIMAPIALATFQVSPVLAAVLAVLLVGANTASAQDMCMDSAAVEVHMDKAAADGILSDMMKSNHSCPPESFYWEHHPEVWGGFKGCVAEIGLAPCGSNGFSGVAGMLAAKLPEVYEVGTKSCKKTGFTIMDEKLIITGGLPHDGPELKKRTGIFPVISFPLIRSPYPKYLNSEVDSNDDEDMKATLKEFMMYQKAFTKDELATYDVMGTEGAEQGMVTIHAGKALEIAMTTCNRAIYVLVEAPSYGYTTNRIQQLVNEEKSKFLKVHTNWYNATGNVTINYTCPDVDVTVEMVGWFPGTGYPSKMSGYMEDVIATSTMMTSPWFESLVYPENPSGKVKTSNIPASMNRLVCDGCYLYPTYFGPGQTKGPAEGAPASYYEGMSLKEGYYIPKTVNFPKCDAWAFSITKMYSASVRAGTVMYKKNNAAHYLTIGKKWSSLSEGSVSEWTWTGQIQIWKLLMSKPLFHPQSWMGAYAKLQDEKSQFLVDGFKNCPVIDYLNPKTTAYSFYKYKYIGRTASTPDWWLHTLNIAASDYSGSFRDADPSELYGAGTTKFDFKRLHLYREVGVYKEVGRRAAIVCAGGKLPGMMSTAEWAAVAGHTASTNGSGRKLLAADATFDTSHVNHNDHTTIHLAHFSPAEKSYHTDLHRQHLAYQAIMAACTEANTMDTECMFRGMDAYNADFSPVTTGAIEGSL